MPTKLCPKCKRRFILTQAEKQLKPPPTVCALCRYGIPVNGSSKMEYRG